MEDIYSALVGEPVSDREKLAMLAQKLRKQQQIGQLGQITGDRVLAPMGAGIMKNTNDIAERLGQQGSTDRWRKTQDAMNERSVLARAAEAEENRKFTAGQNALERALRRELEGMRQSKDAKTEAAAKKDLARYVERYGKEIGKAELPAMESYITDADKILGQYDGKDLPGIGFMDFSSKYSQEGSSTRQAVQAVQNALLKALSGAAVTQSEFERLEKQMFGPLATEESFRQGWAGLKAAVAAKRMNIEKSYDPLVIEAYNAHEKGSLLGGGGAEESVSKNPEDYDTYEEYLQAVGGE